jgi:phosphate uptake regulator
MAEDSQMILRATPSLFVAKYLERIADHATNIVGMAVFLIKGRDIPHMDKRQQIGQEVRCRGYY